MSKILLFLFSHRLLAIARFDIHLLAMRILNILTLQNVRIAKKTRNGSAPLLLNLGSGPRGLKEDRWINVDAFRDENVDYLVDIGRKLPFSDATFSGVFCEHVLEHFSEEGGEKLAKEVFRILEEGGAFRIVVPDAEKIIRAFIESPEELVTRRGGTPIQAVNSYFRQRYEHQFLYDWTTLKKLLNRSGFSLVVRSDFNKSERADLSIDDPKYAWESLYVDAIKQKPTKEN